MKKPVLALMVSAIAFGGMLSTAQADTTTCNDPLKSCSGHNEWRSQT